MTGSDGGRADGGMVAAFFGTPHLGGTYSVFRNLRSGLGDRLIELRWIATGAAQSSALLRDPWPSEMAYGTVVAPEETDERRQGAALVDHLERGGYDAVFVNVLADRVQTNAIRYLDPKVRRVMVVHNITPATYAAAAAVRDHVHATVCVSPRIRDDLVARHGFDPARVRVILNATVVFQAPRPPRAPITADNPLRLLSLGRVEDASKGVLWLPELLSRLAGAPVTLTVGGSGPDLAALRERCAPFGKQVKFVGAVRAETVPALMAGHDVLIFPSRFEGFGLTLAEAMAAGCVPVASAIRGVTNFLIEHGRTGLLFPVGDIGRAELEIRRIIRQDGLLMKLSTAAQEEAGNRFDIVTAADAYADLLRTSFRHPSAIAASLPISRWSYPRGLCGGGIRRFIPQSVKNLLREWREQAALGLSPPESGRSGAGHDGTA